MGGVDSIVLLDLIYKYYKNIYIVYINYNLRTKYSVLDNLFIINLKNRYINTNIFINNLFINNKRSLQNYTRNIRYKIFNKLDVHLKFKYIILGHNLNDNIETSILNFFRSCNLKGIIGINHYNKFIRPLKYFSKKEIYTYAFNKKLFWKEDNSNNFLIYKRNIIRYYLNKFFLNIKFFKKNILKTFLFIKNDFFIINNIKKYLYNKYNIYNNKFIKIFYVINNINYILKYYLCKNIINDITLLNNIFNYNNNFCLIINKKHIIYIKRHFFIFIKKEYFLNKNYFYKIIYKKKIYIKYKNYKIYCFNKINKKIKLIFRNLFFNDFVIIKNCKLYILYILKYKITFNNLNKIIVIIFNNNIIAFIYKDIVYNYNKYLFIKIFK
ncbi:MAG: tRNA lysidine(34) synthetase TilS [Candidatus Shikimatogenerans sp. AspAUS03]|uniref:tRNA(Ile)-lysidine synthetase n=1 Tax=Candidatus Shikimatogenerans sp. AspAUS03 TaxID=3158563 RepID=A0AAU7QSK8_9FLAO